jgi:ribosomal protein S18 acetylase RimI-like enzyme
VAKRALSRATRGATDDTVRLRRAKAGDLAALLAIDEWPRVDAARRRWLREMIRTRGVYLLSQRGRPLAYGVLRRSFLGGRHFVEQLWVARNARRQGWGGALLAHFETLAMRSGEVWTSTNRSNKRMQRLLKKRGFVLRGRVSGLDAGDAELFYVKKGLR